MFTNTLTIVVTGIDEMGLFWSLSPNPHKNHNVRMVTRNGDDPVLYHLSIYRGHLSISDITDTYANSRHHLVSTTLSRKKKSNDVLRIPIKAGNIRGTLFIPNGIY